MKFREFASLLARPTPRRDPLSRCHSIDDLRERANAFLPRGLFDFVEGGSGDETTLRRNRRALREFELVQSPPVSAQRALVAGAAFHEVEYAPGKEGFRSLA